MEDNHGQHLFFRNYYVGEADSSLEGRSLSEEIASRVDRGRKSCIYTAAQHGVISTLLRSLATTEHYIWQPMGLPNFTFN